MTPDILHRDGRLVAVNKPAGLDVIPGRGEAAERGCLRDILAERLGTRVWVVHRLDRDTSGVVIFALDAEAHRSLCLQFEGRAVEKIYDAVVQGEPREEAGEIVAPLRTFGSGREGVSPDGKPSVTRWRVRRRGAGIAGLEVRPLTGRRHQIRVHLFHIGHPVWGDPLYGLERPVGGGSRLMLHARRLTLLHPDGGDWTAQAPVPEDFAAVLGRLPEPESAVEK